MAGVTPKAVVVIFDISGSMEKYDMLSRGREEVIRLVRGGLKPGDTWVVYAFDTATRQMAERMLPKDGVDGAVAEVPGELSHKPGTNIRWAHHEALKWVEHKHPRKTFLILVSDSYNDPPASDDPAMKEFGAYYAPKSLTAYPDTPENRDYVRLLRLRDALGITSWGVGVTFDRQSGRPIERYLTAPEGESAPAATAMAPVTETVPSPGGGNRWLWLAALLAAFGVVVWLWSRRMQPVGVSLAESARVFRNYRLRPGAAISLGGAGAGEYDLGYPIAGTTHPVAALRRAGNGFRLEPAAEGSSTVAVMVNGEPAKDAAALALGDEIKLRLPGAGAAPPREVRLEFGRTREEA